MQRYRGAIKRLGNKDIRYQPMPTLTIPPPSPRWFSRTKLVRSFSEVKIKNFDTQKFLRSTMHQRTKQKLYNEKKKQEKNFVIQKFLRSTMHRRKKNSTILKITKSRPVRPSVWNSWEYISTSIDRMRDRREEIEKLGRAKIDTCMAKCLFRCLFFSLDVYVLYYFFFLDVRQSNYNESCILFDQLRPRVC